MSVHIEWVLVQDFTLGGDRHRLRIGNVRLGEALEEWLDDYQAACTVRIFDDRAYFSLAIHEQGRLDFSRALLGARAELRAILQPLGVRWI
jgi:ABC-type hemin transport system ATPase subunit